MKTERLRQHYVIALIFPGNPASGEDIAFQLTMPGLEEELFYRGILLFALDQAFTGRRRFLGSIGDGARSCRASCSDWHMPVASRTTALPSIPSRWR